MSVRRVTKIDAGAIGDVERTPQGGIRVPARLTRIGVFPYRMGDGTTRRELRPPEEVFDEASLASLSDAPVTDLHPGEPVTPENWRSYSIGHVASRAVVEGGTFVAATLAIQAADGIDKIDSGDRREVSLGYSCEVEATSGVWNGEPYDAIQRTIRYNHVAIGPDGWGRAGREVSLRLDAADGIEEDTREDHSMKIKIAGKEYEAGSAEAAKAIEALEQRADASDAKVKAYEEAEKKAKRAKIVDAVKMLRARAGKRLDAGEEKAIESASDLDLMLMLLKTEPSFDAENTSEEYIRGSFAAYVKRKAAETSETVEEPLDSTTEEPAPSITAPAPTDNGLDRALDSVTALRPPRLAGARQSKEDTSRDDGEEIDAEKARRAMIDENRKRASAPLRSIRGGRAAD